MIKQPKNSAGMITLKWNPGFASERNACFARTQEYIDSACIRYMKPYTPMQSGILYKSATIGTKIGSGAIQYQVPYARYQYYGKLMVSSTTGSAYSHGESKVLTEIDLQYSKTKHSQAGKLWFERMKVDKKDAILRGAVKIVGGKPR